MAVQTETYANVLARVEALLGDGLTTTEKARFKASLNRRARLIYKRFDAWPSFIVGKKARRVNGSSGIEHVILETDGTDTGADHIDEILKAWQNEPFADICPCPLDIYEQDDTSYLVDYDYVYDEEFALSSVLQVVSLLNVETTTPHSLKTGDKVKISGTTLETPGDPDVNGIHTVYTALTSDTFTIALDDPTFFSSRNYGITDAVLSCPRAWLSYRKRYVGNYGDGAGETATVPHEWADYLVQACYADTLRADGQTEKAAAEEVMAEGIMSEELWRQDRKLSKTDIITTVQTHGSRAYR